MALAAMPSPLYLTASEGHVRKRANHPISGGLSVAKAELGTKRVCPTTGRKFYDLNKDPIISPYTGMVVPVAPVVVRASRAAEKAAAAAVPVAAEEVAVEEEEVEVISLDEADEEETTTGKKKDGADDIDIEDEEIPDAADDDTFLEEDEDDEVDAAELIDGELPGEEEA
jgi:uncharacterized protein (TIGR02300 family)